MVRAMRLTEQYYMLTKCGLTPVRGKKYTEDYAITYNHEKKLYNVTHIKSGTCISKDGFRRMKDCISEADTLVSRRGLRSRGRKRYYFRGSHRN